VANAHGLGLSSAEIGIDWSSAALSVMAELSEANFAQTFLAQLSARPIKYAAEFTVPASTLGAKPLIVWLSRGVAR
jgi:hypothetical protein